MRVGLNYKLASNGVAAPVYMTPARQLQRRLVEAWLRRRQVANRCALQRRCRGHEADIQATNQHAGPTYVCPGALCNATITGVDTPVTVAHDYKLDWFATVRGRLGVAVTPDTVVYATGGVSPISSRIDWPPDLGTAEGTAVTDQVDYVATLRGRLGYAFGHWLVTQPADTPGRRPAWVAGRPAGMRAHDPILVGKEAGSFMGTEVAIAADWTAKLEYLYYHFGDVAGTFPSGTSYKSSFDLQTVRLGLNRQLDWGNPGSVGSWTGDPQLLASGNWNVHGQLTFIGQGHGQFHSPYFSDNSLFGGSQYKNTTSATAFIGVRPWAGTEIYVDPEWMQGNGLSDTFGLGGFPNGEAQKSGFPMPRMNIGRVFVRQTFGLGGEQETMEDGPNQLAGKQDISRITVTAGKFQVTDLFDNNAYSHDPRTSFLNWNLQCCGAYDWDMDKVGYTWGAAIDFNQKYWAFRVGYFLLPVFSNDNRFDTQITKHGEYIGELELRYSLLSQPGKLRLMAWANVGNAGSYSEAVAEPLDTPNYPDIALTRNTRTNYGFVVNVEQALTDQLGLFSCTSWNAGKTEILGWTDCNESFSLGAVLKGKGWGRPDDKIGVAGVINGLSPEARAYFAAGGLGILIGDGALNYRRRRYSKSTTPIASTNGRC